MFRKVIIIVATLSLFSVAPQAAPKIKHTVSHAHSSALMGEVGSKRPKGCPSRWCGCWLGIKLGDTSKALWRARNWAKWGTASTPRPGAVMVMRHHVAYQIGWCDTKRRIVRAISGNTRGDDVGVSCYPVHKAIAFRTNGGGLVHVSQREGTR